MSGINFTRLSISRLTPGPYLPGGYAWGEGTDTRRRDRARIDAGVRRELRHEREEGQAAGGGGISHGIIIFIYLAPRAAFDVAEPSTDIDELVLFAPGFTATGTSAFSGWEKDGWGGGGGGGGGEVPTLRHVILANAADEKGVREEERTRLTFITALA
jgi:hypothetical protein